MSFQLSTLQVHRVVSLSGTGDAREGKQILTSNISACSSLVYLELTSIVALKRGTGLGVPLPCPYSLFLLDIVNDKERSDRSLFMLLLSLLHWHRATPSLSLVTLDAFWDGGCVMRNLRRASSCCCGSLQLVRQLSSALESRCGSSRSCSIFITTPPAFVLVNPWQVLVAKVLSFVWF